MDSQDRDQVEAIIRRMVGDNPDVINAVVADEVGQRLGTPIGKDRIARIRRDMGLGMFDRIAGDMVADLASMAKISPPTGEYNLQDLALIMAATCIRRTVLESYHAGQRVKSKTGDYSDVTVVTPYGEIPWLEAMRITDEEMKALNIEVSNRIYTVLEYLFNPEFEAGRDTFMATLANWYPTDWQKPVLDPGMAGKADRGRDGRPSGWEVSLR